MKGGVGNFHCTVLGKMAGQSRRGYRGGGRRRMCGDSPEVHCEGTGYKKGRGVKENCGFNWNPLVLLVRT